MIFCDTSAVAKFYVFEDESTAVRRHLEAEEVCLSELAHPELLAVFHRRWREQKWTREEFQLACRQFSRDDNLGLWRWLPLDSAVIRKAVQIYTTLPATVFLRSADCLHISSALLNGFAEICTYDRQQTKAAGAVGLKAVVS